MDTQELCSQTNQSRISTGSAGLDDILDGGFPTDRLYLIQGHPGTSKTTIALQFLIEGENGSRDCLFLTLSETRDELRTVYGSDGW